MFAPSQAPEAAAARFAAPAGGRLDAAMKQAFARDGFLVLEGMVTVTDLQTGNCDLGDGSAVPDLSTCVIPGLGEFETDPERAIALEPNLDRFGDLLGTSVNVALAWLGGIAYESSGSYLWMWYADMALSAAAALVNLPIREARIARAPAAA